MSFLISKKRIIFLSLLVIFIVISSLYVTYAVNVYVEEGTSTNYDMSLNFDLSNSLDMQAVVPAGKTKVFDLDITNPYNDSIQYGVAYAMVSPTTLPSGVTIAKLSTSKNETQGLISASSTITVSIIVENTSSSSVTVNFSIITGYKNGGDLIIPTGRVIVTESYNVVPIEMVMVTVENDVPTASSVGDYHLSYYVPGTMERGSLLYAGTYEISLGAKIELEIKLSERENGYIYVNDELVDECSDGGEVHYSYTLTGNISISNMSRPNAFYITEQ